MNRIKIIITAAYLLVFSVYAISPIVASMPQHPFAFHSSSCGEEEGFSPRLQLFDIIAGGDAEQGGTALSSSDGDQADILLRKKRILLSTKILLKIITSDSLALDRPQSDQILPYDAQKPSYYSALYFCVSGVSPPALS